MAPFAMPTLIQASKQSVDTPQMSSPKKRQMKKQKQKIKRESDTKSPKIQVLANKLGFAKGQPFEFGLGHQHKTYPLKVTITIEITIELNIKLYEL